MAKLYAVQVEGPDGWSDWQWPIMRGYKMACCDCGLVHDMDFQVREITKYLGNGEHESKQIRNKKFRVAFRARRNTRSTGQVRRHKKVSDHA